jgi:hypothetical protein
MPITIGTCLGPYEIAGQLGAGGSLSRSVSSILGWRSDGKELWYVTPDLKIMSVELTLEPTFQSSEPKVLFEVPSGTRAQSTDDNRFLFGVPTLRSTQVPITVVQNWPALMNR